MEKKSRRDREKKKKRAWDSRQQSRHPKEAARPVAPWLVDVWTKCPCGTGKSFFECCRPLVPVDNRPMIWAKADESERNARAQLTQYLGWVYRDTVPIAQSEVPELQRIVRIDIAAVSAFADRVAYFMRSVGRESQAPEFFDHLGRTVPLPGIADRMLAAKVVWVDAVLNDAIAANNMLQGVNPALVADRELLEAYLAIAPIPDPFERIRIVDRALGLTYSPDTRTWNLAIKAMLLAVTGDIVSAMAAATDACQSVTGSPGEDADELASLTAARAFWVMFMIGGRRVDGQKAMEWYKSISLESFNSQGKADILHQMGSLQADLGETDEAVAKLRSALDYGYEIAASVRLYEVLVRAHRYEAAADLSASIENSTMSDELHAEYLGAKVLFAVNHHDEIALRAIVTDLAGLRIAVPHFAAARDRACILAMLAIDKYTLGASRPRRNNIVTRLFVRFLRVCAYLELKPNICGLGVNLNKLAEDWLEDKKRQSRL
jgi:hypothetical protein